MTWEIKEISLGTRGLPHHKDRLSKYSSYHKGKTVIFIFIMGIPILVRRHLYIETSSRRPIDSSLQRRHNGRDSVSNHQPHDCLLNRLFRRKSKKTSYLRVTSLCAGNSPGTGEFPTQMASNAENVSIWWRHHVSGWCGSPKPTRDVKRNDRPTFRRRRKPRWNRKTQLTDR